MIKHLMKMGCEIDTKQITAIISSACADDICKSCSNLYDNALCDECYAAIQDRVYKILLSSIIIYPTKKTYSNVYDVKLQDGGDTKYMCLYTSDIWNQHDHTAPEHDRPVGDVPASSGSGEKCIYIEIHKQIYICLEYALRVSNYESEEANAIYCELVAKVNAEVNDLTKEDQMIDRIAEVAKLFAASGVVL